MISLSPYYVFFYIVVMVGLLYKATSMVTKIANPAEAKTLPHEGPSALVT